MPLPPKVEYRVELSVYDIKNAIQLLKEGLEKDSKEIMYIGFNELEGILLKLAIGTQTYEIEYVEEQTGVKCHD